MERDVAHTAAHLLRQSDKMSEKDQAVAEPAAAERDDVVLWMGGQPAIERDRFARRALRAERVL